MATLVSILVLAAAMMIQTVIITSLPLLNGYADLPLLIILAWAIQERVSNIYLMALLAGLMVAAVSALPPFIPVLVYPLAAAMARLLQKRIWQTPILALMVCVVLGTLVQHLLQIAILLIGGTPISLSQALSLVTLPSLLLNLLLALPVYALMTDMTSWMYPLEEEV